MWGKDKNKKVDFDRHAGKTTMIAKGTVINGDVVFEGGLLVEGTIKGNVRAEAGSESLLRLIRRLPGERQHLLILKFVEHLSNAEIGAIMGRSEGAVKSLYHRTLLALRDEIEDTDLIEGE
mgnify:CR=1 FL=1